jgi:DNA polymerase III subunit beta
MRVELSQADFFGMLQTVIDVVPSKGTLPVLSTILMTAENGVCSLSATDLELSVTTRRSMEAVEEGATTFPARKVFDIVRELPEGKLVVHEDGGKFTITSSFGEYSMQSIPSSEFPKMPTSLEGTNLKIDGDLLRRMTTKVAFAVHPDTTRPTLNSVSWRAADNEMIMVATDGHRLAKIAEKVELEGDVSFSVIVPPRVLQGAVKLLQDDEELQSVTIGDRQAHFSYTSTDMYARLVEGAYVDVDSVIPKDNNKHLVIDSDALMPAVRRIQILSSQQNHQIRIALGSNEVELSTLNREIGAEGRESIEAVYSEEPMEVGYNANYLLEVLGKIDTDQVRIKFRESVSAVIVEPAEQLEGEDYFCLLMPLRLVDS